MASGDEQLVSFILRARDKGRTDEQIARSLYSVGWRKERVDAAFRTAEEMKKGVSPREPEEAPHEDEKSGRAEPEEQEEKEPQQPAKPQGRVQLSMPAQPGRISPPAKPQIVPPQKPQQPEMRQPEQPPAQQEERLSRPIQPTIPNAQQRVPIELPHGPDYPTVQDESQVQNPAFQKVAKEGFKIDFGSIARIILFLIIVGVVVAGYFYFIGTGAVIS